MGSKKTNSSLVIIPPPPARFSLSEWYLNQRCRMRCSEDQQQLADRTLAENERVRQKIDEQSYKIKQESNYYIEDRINDLEFRKREAEKQRQEVMLEIDTLTTYKERIFDTLQSIEKDALGTCKKCIILREGRLGIGLCHDDVEKELLKEVEVIEGVQELLRRALEQINEQVRKLRSAAYFIDRDLEDKTTALKLDKHNISLDEKSLNLSMYHGKNLDTAILSVEEWDSIATKNYFAAAKEINSGTMLRTYIDIMLKQVIEDLETQKNAVNEAFKRRIEETHAAKTKLELQHYEITRQINEVNRSITVLEKSLAEKENYMALVHTRLGNRAQRPNVELCRDMAQVKLVEEARVLSDNVVTLQQHLAEAQASLRYLLKTQLQVEEDINIMTNDIKINQVDCMTLRERIVYFAY